MYLRKNTGAFICTGGLELGLFAHLIWQIMKQGVNKMRIVYELPQETNHFRRRFDIASSRHEWSSVPTGLAGLRGLGITLFPGLDQYVTTQMHTHPLLRHATWLETHELPAESQCSSPSTYATTHMWPPLLLWLPSAMSLDVL